MLDVKCNNVSIFLTGGIGDVIALESFFSDDLRNNLETIYYATHKWESIKKLFESVPNYPNLKNHVPVWNDFSKFWCFFYKQNCIDCMLANNMPVSHDFINSIDYGICPMFPKIKQGNSKFNCSSFQRFHLSDISNFKLEYPYIVINPYSTDKRTHNRDFNLYDWDVVINYLHKHKIQGVVLNIGHDYVPYNDLLLNLSNKTNILQSIEIVKESIGFIGIDSALSVIASKCLNSNQIGIKTQHNFLLDNKEVYYAPLSDFSFINNLTLKNLVYYL